VSPRKEDTGMKIVSFKRIVFSAALIGLLICPSWERVFAADYPTKPIELVIPWPAGGRTDTGTRLLAPFLEKAMGVPVVVINKVGGGGLIGMNFVRDTKPDGYTISCGGQALSYYQYEKPGFATLWDYTWIARTYWTPMVLAVNTKSQFKTLKELVEYAKANPRKLKHGNTSTGSTTHIASEKFAKKYGLKFTQVPYKGEGPAVIGIGTGEVDFAFGLMVAFRPLVEEGKLRILGVADEKRDPLYPSVPTFKEEGFAFTEPTWEAIHSPKGLSKEVYEKLSAGCKKALTDRELIQKYAKVGLNLSYQPGSEFTEWLKGWDKDVKEMIFDLGLEAKK
jgi:tripartite-type tricarboxylate transporter receptor subunit TctC